MNNVTELLNHIPPEDYDSWIKVGMALKQEGYSCELWDSWSSSSSKYKVGECEKRWISFDSDELTGGTIYHLACEYGYMPEDDMRNDYDISNLLLDEYHVDPAFVSSEKVPVQSKNYDAKGDMLEYFTTLFKPDDFVGYCTKFSKIKTEGGNHPPHSIDVLLGTLSIDCVKEPLKMLLVHSVKKLVYMCDSIH